MPSFDIVSKIDSHELTNAIDQANREVTTRFDFKGTNAQYVYEKEIITMSAPSEFQLKQMLEILEGKLTKRGLDLRILDIQAATSNLNEAKQQCKVKQGLSTEFAKKIVKVIKDQGLKVQAAIQGDQVRVTGKKRDDLQEVIGFLREQKLELPLQYENFRD